MRIIIDTEKDKNVSVEIDLTEEEKELKHGFFTYSLGISRATTEFLHLFARNKEQASAGYDMLTNIQKDMVNQYIDDFFEEIAEGREEASLYRYMEDIFYAWLKTGKISMVDFQSKYARSTSLYMDIAETEGLISVVLSNGKVADLLTEFPASIVTEDPARFEQNCAMSLIIATVAGDRILGEDKNPIRANYEGIDGGLCEKIVRMLNSN